MNFFFFPVAKEGDRKVLSGNVGRQDELLRKRPERRKYLILSIINKKTTNTDANCI